jgi:hypothetical protein
MKNLAAHKLTMMALFTACVSLTMNSASSFLAMNGISQLDAAGAGFVLLSMANFMLLILMGSFMDGDASGHATKDESHHAAAAPTPAPTHDAPLQAGLPSKRASQELSPAASSHGGSSHSAAAIDNCTDVASRRHVEAV